MGVTSRLLQENGVERLRVVQKGGPDRASEASQRNEGYHGEGDAEDEYGGLALGAGYLAGDEAEVKHGRRPGRSCRP